MEHEVIVGEIDGRPYCHYTDMGDERSISLIDDGFREWLGTLRPGKPDDGLGRRLSIGKGYFPG
jgi:hypothetical protein